MGGLFTFIYNGNPLVICKLFVIKGCGYFDPGVAYKYGVAYIEGLLINGGGFPLVLKHIVVAPVDVVLYFTVHIQECQFPPSFFIFIFPSTLSSFLIHSPSSPSSGSTP